MTRELEEDILSLAMHLQGALGVGVAAVNASGEIWRAAPFCARCALAQCDYTMTHLENSAKAIRGVCLYRCALGLAFAAAPLNGYAFRVVFVAGPFLMGDLNERADEGSKRQTARLPRFSEARANDILYVLASCAAGFESVRPVDAKISGHIDLVRKTKEYISENYRSKLSLDDIAHHVFLSRSHLSSVFKAETGQTLSAYINETRVKKSKALLSETSLPLFDIALRCGFEDQSYFSKVFKTIEGITPKDYRARALRFGWPES